MGDFHIGRLVVSGDNRCPQKSGTNERWMKGCIPSLKLIAKAPENGWLEDCFPFGMAYFQGQTASFRECNDF